MEETHRFINKRGVKIEVTFDNPEQIDYFYCEEKPIPLGWKRVNKEQFSFKKTTKPIIIPTI